MVKTKGEEEEEEEEEEEGKEESWKALLERSATQLIVEYQKIQEVI
jgi:hypothetical protein